MLHLQTVTPTLLKIIRAVCAAPFFQNFRLVGGTALSLHLGHRQSVDADFFSNENFETEEAFRVLSEILPSFTILKQSAHGFAAMYEGVKLDIYTWGAPFKLPPIEKEGIRMADLPDVASLKFEAIINRKEEKDFRDIYALLQRFSLEQLLGFFHQRYPHHSMRVPTDHLLAAPYVERDTSIVLFQKLEWEELSSAIVEAVRYYYEEKKRKKEELEFERLQKRMEQVKKKKEK